MEDDQKATQIRNHRRKLLLELANINLGGRLSVPFQRRLARFEPAPLVDSIREAQDDLRSTWSPIPSDFVLHKWLGLAAAKPSRIDTVEIGNQARSWSIKDAALVPNLSTGQIEFVETNFYGQLITAVLENWRTFRKCGNPGCPARFFFATRRNQRYCERGDCTKYAQQQHALKWWRENRQKKGGS